ncbi:MAG TPA: zf-HC2 domain-containing protein [Candidatus Methylomirabilis sp.]|nr:zf-HC2 domain-containing protein [Candidatus Methylomirabilis sp.]
MIMGHSSCDWVHDWLPLLVDDSDGLACDLNAEDRRLIEQHLIECSSCRQHQAALEKAISVLRIAAADWTAGLRAPSLWPKLEERIQRHQEQSRSRWLRTLRALSPEGIRITADRFFCGCGQLRSNLPLQLTWTRDSLGDFLANRAWPVFSGSRSRLGKTYRFVTPRVGFGFSLALAGVIVFLLVVIMQRWQTQAEARIAADTAPPPSMQLPLTELSQVSEDVVTGTSSNTVSRASDSLSLASPAVPAAAASMGQVATTKTASTITTTTATATSAPRYDFDLEHGTPMPPESRAGKPAY